MTASSMEGLGAGNGADLGVIQKLLGLDHPRLKFIQMRVSGKVRPSTQTRNEEKPMSDI
jgi:hypothetical protein